MTYTQAALLGVAVTVLLDMVVLRTRLLGRRIFWASYAIIVFFQLLSNGVLTGRGIVFYASHAVAGVGSVAGERPPMFGQGRVFYAPFEDLLFGFSLVVQTLAWWVFWGRRDRDRDRLAAVVVGAQRNARS